MAIFALAHPKIIDSTFSFPELVPAWKNHFIPSVHFWDTVSFRVPWPDRPHPFLTNAHPKNFWTAFNSCDHVSTCKKSVYSICSFFNYSQFFRVPSPDWPHPFLTMINPETFNHLLICVKLCQHANKSVNSISSFIRLRYNQFQSSETRLATPIFDDAQPKHFWSAFNFCKFVSICKKNEAVSLICSGETIVVKILQSKWLIAFWPIAQEQDLSQIEDLCRNRANHLNSHYI